MAHTVEITTRTPFMQLREALDKAERLVVQVEGNSIVGFLTLLDEIDQRFEALEGDEFDLRPEQTRWHSLLSRIDRQPNNIVRAANAAGGFEKLRAAHPPAESFWWHLDKEVARRRIQNIRRMLTTLVTLVVLLVGGYYAINYFFPPDPEAVLMVETNNSLDRVITEERWEDGLAIVQAARAQSPTNVELMIWEAVLHEQLGNAAAAAAALADAEQILPDQPIQVLIYLGNIRLRVGDLAGAQAAGEEALTLDPNNPQVYFLLGGVAEMEGNIPLAVQYFEQTFELAEESNPSLAVTARVRMGNLLQNPGAFTTAEGTPAASPEATTTP